MKKSVSITAEPIPGGKKGVPQDYRMANVFTVTPVIHVLGFSVPIGTSKQIILPRSVNEAVEKITAIKQNFENPTCKKSFNEAVPDLVEAQLINQGFNFYDVVEEGAMCAMYKFGQTFGYDVSHDIVSASNKTYKDYMGNRALQKKASELSMGGPGL